MECPILDAAKVGSLIPQKHPFVMVDRLLDYSETHLVAGLEVKASNIFWAHGVFREPGLIEHMAQSVALHTGYQFWLRQETAPTGYIGSISNLTIAKLPQEHDVITTQVKILQEVGGITMVEIETRLNDELIATGQMKTVLAS